MSRVIVEEKFKCKECKEEHLYKSTEIAFDYLVCKSCGCPIKVVKYVHQVDSDYTMINNTVQRRKPKVHMTKKARRKLNTTRRQGNETVN